MFISTFYINIQYQIFSQKNTYIDDIYLYYVYNALLIFVLPEVHSKDSTRMRQMI